MKKTNSLTVATFVFLISILPLNPVSAEQVARIFVGPAWTQNQDVKHDFTGFGTFDIKGIDFATGPAVGWGLGHWFGSFPYLGLGLDVHFFKFNSNKQSADICFGGACAQFLEGSQHYRATAIAFPVMGRFPLSVSKEYPNGRTQPYVLVGPTIFAATYTDPGHHFGPENRKANDTSAGVTAGAGLSFMLTPKIDLFAEYRFTHFSPEFKVTDTFGDPAKVKLNANTHRLLFGLSFHFCLFSC